MRNIDTPSYPERILPMQFLELKNVPDHNIQRRILF